MCKISKLFPKTLCVDGKYFVLDRDNLTQRCHIQLYQKEKNFSQFFSSFLKYCLNLQSFQEKDDTHSTYNSKITDSEKHG